MNTRRYEKPGDRTALAEAKFAQVESGDLRELQVQTKEVFVAESMLLRRSIGSRQGTPVARPIVRRVKKMARELTRSVLIIEKQPNYTQLLVKQVMFAGLRPVVAVTGEGGLRKALEFHPDMILLELDLTDMNGLEFVALVKEKPRLQKVPIVAMSIFPHLKAAALHGGCNDFLQKPVKMIDLMSHIKRCLRRNPTPSVPTSL